MHAGPVVSTEKNRCPCVLGTCHPPHTYAGKSHHSQATDEETREGGGRERTALVTFLVQGKAGPGHHVTPPQAYPLIPILPWALSV